MPEIGEEALVLRSDGTRQKVIIDKFEKDGRIQVVWTENKLKYGKSIDKNEIINVRCRKLSDLRPSQNSLLQTLERYFGILFLLSLIGMVFFVALCVFQEDQANFKKVNKIKKIINSVVKRAAVFHQSLTLTQVI